MSERTVLGPRQFVRLVYECGHDERDEIEAKDRGYRSHVWVELTDGSLHRVTFFAPVRLQQELEMGIASGRPYFAEPGLIVIPEVTGEAMERAARALVDERFFDDEEKPSPGSDTAN